MAAKKAFDYELDHKSIDFRARRDPYRIGKGEQGVLLVEPYKSKILPQWRFKTQTSPANRLKRSTRCSKATSGLTTFPAPIW